MRLLAARPNTTRTISARWLVFSLVVALLFPALSFAQAPTAEGAAVAPIEIADQPTAIDPATILDPIFATKVRVQFKESTLRDVVAWTQQQTKKQVILDQRSLESAGILDNEPVVDRLDDEPLYLLLDRLEQIGVSWWMEGDVIRLASGDEDHDLTTRQYNVGDLFDAGHNATALADTLQGAIATESWDVTGGEGGVVVLGDVLFVRQTHRNHRRVAGLLAALRNHSRRTLILDPAKHESIRAALDRRLDATFTRTPLSSAVEQLSNLTNTDIRLDKRALEDLGVGERTPVDLSFAQQPLRVVLNILTEQLELDWRLNHGVLWVTTSDSVEQDSPTAVYDVRDLCRDDEESAALADAISSQSHPDAWDEMGGPGDILFPVAGTMVIRQSERIQDEVLELLENYRAALRVSKRRRSPDTDPQAVVTRYYRVPTNVADDLIATLPELVRPGTWRTDELAEAPGRIQKVASWADYQLARDPMNLGVNPGPAVAVPHSVLIIRQTRETHAEILELLSKVEHGESLSGGKWSDGGFGGGGGGFGGGGGGFGGGFFSIPSAVKRGGAGPDRN